MGRRAWWSGGAEEEGGGGLMGLCDLRGGGVAVWVRS